MAYRYGTPAHPQRYILGAGALGIGCWEARRQQLLANRDRVNAEFQGLKRVETGLRGGDLRDGDLLVWKLQPAALPAHRALQVMLRRT